VFLIGSKDIFIGMIGLSDKMSRQEKVNPSIHSEEAKDHQPTAQAAHG
jgi:hypothetical protein